jgi:hypothetical protein
MSHGPDGIGPHPSVQPLYQHRVPALTLVPIFDTLENPTIRLRMNDGLSAWWWACFGGPSILYTTFST